MLAYGGLRRIPEADFVLDRHRYGVFGHDWRRGSALPVVPSEARPPADSPAALKDAPAPLDEGACLDAVRAALRDYMSPDALRANALIDTAPVCALAGAGAGRAERVAALRTLLAELIEPLKANPRRLKFYRAIYHTYVDPAPSQEEVAELLDIPFSTYRGHLKEGLQLVAGAFYQRLQDLAAAA
jgi:hypothetical protein